MTTLTSQPKNAPFYKQPLMRFVLEGLPLLKVMQMQLLSKYFYDELIPILKGWSFTFGKNDHMLYELYEFDNEKMRVFNSINRKRQEIPYDFELRESACTWTNDGLRLFVTGGFSDGQQTSEMVNHELQSRAEMIDERFNHCMTAVANHLLIVIGGSRFSKVFDRCELYQLEDDSWKKGPKLNQVRSQSSVVAIETTVYVFGGMRLPVSNVERLTIGEKMKWENITLPTVYTIKKISYGFGAVAISENKIIVFGGVDIDEDMTDCSLVFDTMSNKFEKASPLPEKDMFVSFTTRKKVGNRVLALGENCIQSFDIQNRKWTHQKR